MAFHARSAGPPPFERRFTELREIRNGPRFSVTLAREPGAGRMVAIKTVADASLSWLGDLLEHEGAVLARVGGHPHIVSLHERLTLPDGRPALLLQGGARVLEDALREDRQFTAAEAASIGVRLADALEYLHDAGYVHSNVRPRAVLVGEHGEPVLAGFDEAVARDATDLVRPLHVTTPHTAPEVLEGGVPTPASDVYGLASTLYELVSGRAAFQAYAGESPAAVIVRVLSTPVRPITAPGVPLELSDLLTWGLAADPARRPPSPAWIGEELRRQQTRQGWHDAAPALA